MAKLIRKKMTVFPQLNGFLAMAKCLPPVSLPAEILNTIKVILIRESVQIAMNVPKENLKKSRKELKNASQTNERTGCSPKENSTGNNK